MCTQVRVRVHVSECLYVYMRACLHVYVCASEWVLCVSFVFCATVRSISVCLQVYIQIVKI